MTGLWSLMERWNWTKKPLTINRYLDDVHAKTRIGRERGVQTTSTLFITGEKIEGVIPFDQLQSLIEKELAGASS